MMKLAKLSIIFGGAALAVIGGLYLLLSGFQGPGLEERPFLAGLSERRFDRIEISGIDAKGARFDWSLVREIPAAASAGAEGPALGGWILGGAGSVAIDRLAAIQLFGALFSLRPAHWIDDKELISKPEVFGLDRPDLKVNLHPAAAGSPEIALVFGKKHQFTGRRYLRFDSSPKINPDQKIYLVEEQSYLAIKKQRSDLEVRSPLRFDTSRVQGIRISRQLPGQELPALRLERSGKADWSVAADQGPPVSADAAIVNDLLAALSAQQTEESIAAGDGSGAEYGLDQPKAVVALEFSGDAVPNPLILNYGEQKPAAGSGSSAGAAAAKKQYFVRAGSSTVVFRLKQRPKQDLFQPADYFWPRKPFSPLASAAISAVQIRIAEKSGSISGTFPQPEQQGGEKATPFQYLVSRIVDLEVISYDPAMPAAAPAGFELSGSGPSGEVFRITVEGPIDTDADPQSASRFPPYSVLLSKMNQPAVRGIVSGAEIELYRQIFKRLE